MKISRFCFCLAFVAITSFLNAQKGFEAGAAFQFQSTWMTNDADFDAGPELDFSKTFQVAYGVNLGYGFSNRHGIRVGAFMSQMGQKFITSKDYSLLPATRFQTLTEYIQIPVLYRYNGDLSLHNTSFMITAGPQFGLLQKASGSSVLQTTDTATHVTVAQITEIKDAKSVYNSLDISAQLGLGLLARFSPKFHMNAMVNFSYSLQDIESATYKMINRPVTRNGVIGIQLAFYYLIGGPPMAGPPKMQ